MSRASRRLNRESSIRANNVKGQDGSGINRHHSHSETKEERMNRMRELYKQTRQDGDN